MWLRLGALLASATLVGTLAGCTPTSAPTTSAGTPSATITPALDFTQPGQAKTMVSRLVKASGSTKVVMVEIRKYEASVSVVVDGVAQTWAYRDGVPKQVPTDLAYVAQATFNPDDFDFSDVGALFRAAAAVSGSDQTQELQIVDRQVIDHRPSEIMMAVSTLPETRTVFFYRDGRLLPTLDFNTQSGIKQGLADAIGSRTSVVSLGLSRSQGAWVEYPGQDSTVTRRQRTAKFPVTVSQRSSNTNGQRSFDPREVKADVVWGVLTKLKDSTNADVNADWTMTAAQTTAGVRLTFVLGGTRLVTDLQGNPIKKA